MFAIPENLSPLFPIGIFGLCISAHYYRCAKHQAKALNLSHWLWSLHQLWQKRGLFLQERKRAPSGVDSELMLDGNNSSRTQEPLLRKKTGKLFHSPVLVTQSTWGRCSGQGFIKAASRGAFWASSSPFFFFMRYLVQGWTSKHWDSPLPRKESRPSKYIKQHNAKKRILMTWVSACPELTQHAHLVRDRLD